jgi:hypothetical protein
MGRGNRTDITVSGSLPRFQELIQNRVEVIENRTASLEYITEIRSELELIAPSLIETIKDAVEQGAPDPTFTHDGVKYTVYAAQVNYRAYKKNVNETVLAVEREIPESRLNASNCANYERKLLLLQSLKIKSKHKPYAWWGKNLSMIEARNLALAPEDLVISFAENAKDIFEQLVRRSKEKVGRAENGLRSLGSLREQLA